MNLLSHQVSDDIKYRDQTTGQTAEQNQQADFIGWKLR